MPVPTSEHQTLSSRKSNDAIGVSTGSSLNFVGSRRPSDSHDMFSFLDLDARDSAEQLEALNNQLAVENRIKEGAENLLNMQLNDTLRSQVEEELNMANDKIEAITKQIDMQSSRGKKKVNGMATANGKRKFAGQAPAGGNKVKDDGNDRDDFRTTLQHATAAIETLTLLGRQLGPRSAPTSPSSSSFPQVPNAEETDRVRVETMSKFINILQRNLRVRYEINQGEVVNAVIPALADSCSKQCRATAYRLIRHILVDSDSVKRLMEQPLEWYIVKSLTRDKSHAVEKEQVIKLIRAIVEIGSEKVESPGVPGAGAVPLSEPIMRAVIAVAEHAEDPFRSICIQTLAEILIIDIDLVARTGGIRFLLHALGEGPPEMGMFLATAFLSVIDSPRKRAYFHLGTDLEIAFSAVTDAYGKPSDHDDRMRGCAKVIRLMLRSWSGLMYFCMEDMSAIRSIIDTLRIPSLDTREIILDMFFDLLNIKTSDWFKTFIDGKRLTMYRKSRQSAEKAPETERPREAFKLTDQYLALLVLVLTDAGLLDALTAMLEESANGSNLSRKATLLMAEILHMANRVLPLSLASKLQTIPHIFDLASHYDCGEHRMVGTQALSAIDSFNRNKARLEPPPTTPTRPRASSTEDAVRRGQRQVEQVKIKIGMQMDDRTFQASLLETQVIITKDYTKWNFDMLQELVEGPLLNPKRMEEAIKVSKFIRRLMSFFHPFSHRFSDLPNHKSNHKWVRLGCSLLTTLMSSPEGSRYLATEDLFLTQIVRGFAQLDPFNGTPDSDPIFSKKRVADTLTFGYFEMLGTLSKHNDGVELLEKFNVFTAFYHLSELQRREDLIKDIVEHLHYDIDGHPRIVLSKALTSTYKHIRLYSTNYLGELILSSSHASPWSLRLLLTQLYDPAPEVCEAAVHYMEVACESKEVLQLIVEMQPTMDHLGEIGHPLLLKFMSTPMGFRYLYDAGYIDREIDMWFHERNIFYVVQVEVFLTKIFSYDTAEDDEDILAFDGTVPPHFYGEMSKTELGCQVLQEKGHFTEFSQFIKQHGLEKEDNDLIMKLKSILWAVGNVGATEGGLPFLEEEDVIPAILEIAEQSLIPSVRGTCFFVLGLIASTTQGTEILDDYQWEAILSPLGSPTGLCIPLEMGKFISLPPWEPLDRSDGDGFYLQPPSTQTELEVITAIHNLANTVVANAASRSLARMKTRPEYRSVFSSTSAFYRALHIISTTRYRLPVRRYIMDLFNIELDYDIVQSLAACAKSLRVPRSQNTAPQLPERVVSMSFRLGRSRRMSESEGDEDESDVEEERVVRDIPTISLRPVSVITGFAI